MNRHALHAVYAVCGTAAVIVGVIITHDASILWLLLLLAFFL